MSESDDLWHGLQRMRRQEDCEHDNVNDMIANGIKQFSVCADCGKVFGGE